MTAKFQYPTNLKKEKKKKKGKKKLNFLWKTFLLGGYINSDKKLLTIFRIVRVYRAT
jgi:hypothetical protein